MSAARFAGRRAFRHGPVLAALGAAGLLLTPTRRRILYDGPEHAPRFSGTVLVTEARRYQQINASADDAAANTKKGDAEIIDQINDSETYAPAFELDDESAWAQFSRNFDIVLEGIKRVEWSGLGNKITDFVLPVWAKHLPERIQKLQFELSMQEGTLADEIWREAHDPDINPEILWNARVRVGDTLSTDELAFRKIRKKHMVEAFKKYMDLNEDVDSDDIPTIAMCGSGGGLRAMVAGSSSYLSAQQAGLYDCVTYTAGVSGSCWLQTLYFSSLGKQNYATLLHHIKSRTHTHIAFPPPALKMMTSAPTNKFILSGFIEKLRGDPGATFGLVDIYSLMLAARFMVPRGDLDVQDSDLKLSNQRIYLEHGAHPMPIYSLVRHEIPVEEEAEKRGVTNAPQLLEAKEQAKKEAWFQWIELTPWEVWCEEFGAGIPTWSLGRPFQDGSNKLLEDTGTALPELRQSLLLGIYGSAFCATLAHYYKEIRPLLSGLTGFGGLDGLLEEKNDDLAKIHPIEPATIPNYVYGMRDVLPKTCPESVFKSDHLQVMDAGMSNNLPIYPLLRPGRDVEVLIAFDASADIEQENWLSVVDGYARQRGVKSWPVGTGWPRKNATPEQNAEAYEKAQAQNPQEAAQKVAEVRDKSRARKGEEKEQDDGSSTTISEDPSSPTNISYCNIWVGTKEERSTGEEPPPSKRLLWDDPDDTTFHLMKPNATMAVIYFPLLPNDDVPGVDPDKTDFLSTWNFIYTAEQVDNVVALAKSNFEAGQEATKRTIRAVYERKKAARLQSEEQRKLKWWRKKLRSDADTFSGT